MSKLPELLESLAKVRREKAEVTQRLSELKEQEETAKTAVEQMLRDIGLKSAKTEDGRLSVSMTTKQNLRITDSKAFLNYVKENKLDVDYYTAVNTTAAKQLATAALKETGEIVPGAEQETVEYLSFREKKD